MTDGNLAGELAALKVKQQRIQLFHERFVNRQSLLGTGVDDLRRAHARADWSDPADRRSYVRTFFAMVEGAITCMKEMLLDSPLLVDVRLTEAEVALLRERRYALTENGLAKESPLLLSVPSNLRFAFNMLARVWLRQLDIDYSGNAWLQFRAAVRIRNRLVHPRSVTDYDVGDADLETIALASALFRSANLAFWDALKTELQGRGKALQEEMERRRRELGLEREPPKKDGGPEIT